MDNTAVSYNHEAGGIIYDTLGALVSPSTPMIFDIAAAQFLYGASSYNSGNSSYDIDGDGTIETTDSVTASDTIHGHVVTLWDSGGIDTLDASGAAGNSRIDLREGFETYSVDGSGNVSFSNQYYSKIGGSLVFLAFNADIEHAKGGNGNDVIYGNDVGNLLQGGGDSWDKLYGGDGNDTLEGTDGYDLLEGGAGADSLVGSDQQNSVFGGDGNDTVSIAESSFNTIEGGGGNDLLFTSGLGTGSVLLGGDGNDTIRHQALTGSYGEGINADGGAEDDDWLPLAMYAPHQIRCIEFYTEMRPMVGRF